MSIVAKRSPISASAEHLLLFLVFLVTCVPIVINTTGIGNQLQYCKVPTLHADERNLSLTGNQVNANSFFAGICSSQAGALYDVLSPLKPSLLTACRARWLVKSIGSRPS